MQAGSDRTSSILILLASCLQTCMTYHCCVYSEKLLMTVRGTVWNMWFHSKNKFEKIVHLVGFIVRNLGVNVSVTQYHTAIYEWYKISKIFNKGLQHCYLAIWQLCVVTQQGPCHMSSGYLMCRYWKNGPKKSWKITSKIKTCIQTENNYQLHVCRDTNVACV